MHEVHHGGHGKSPGALALELLMICVGVFLGLQVDQWKENRAHRESAHAALENFRTEIEANRGLIAARANYHRGLLDSLNAVHRAIVTGVAPPPRLESLFSRIGFQGTQSVTFRHTAYDLSLATGALSYLDSQLAFTLATVYDNQASFQRYQDTFLSNMLTPVSFNDAHAVPIARTLGAFMFDVVSQENSLTASYDKVLPRIDSALAKMPK